MSSSPAPTRRVSPARIRFFAGAIVSYLAVPLLNAVSPLLALPAITASYGSEAWAAIAVGQSLGGTAGILVELGWGLSGSQRVARMSPRNRANAFGVSLVAKAVVGIPTIGIAVWLSFLLAPEGFGDTAAVVAAAAAIAMFSGGWIFVGILKPRLFLYTEALPRALLIAASAVAIHLGAALWTYTGALLLASVAAPIAGGIVLKLRPRDFVSLSPRRLMRVIGHQRAALSSSVFSSVYISLGTAVATLGSPNATLLFASVDRLQRMVQQVVRPVGYVLKGWVGREVDPESRVHRAVRATFVSGSIGVVSGALFALASPWAAEVIFSGTVHVPPLAAVISGLSIAVMCTSVSTGGVLLVSLRRVSAVATSAAVGAAVGLPGIFFGAMFFGGTGALTGQLLAEVSVLIVQIVAARRRLRQIRETGRLQMQPPTMPDPDPLHGREADPV
ncbi:lipopolysaccharide biosynthesis protein [Leifsonia sp. McL0607]|uniref:lipopolysaccharide biosynthesis protein n=1 Tax=Leifsonia sp. McL0607 TaxID=3415672 RepID=UPI003CEFBF8F